MVSGCCIIVFLVQVAVASRGRLLIPSPELAFPPRSASWIEEMEKRSRRAFVIWWPSAFLAFAE